MNNDAFLASFLNFSYYILLVELFACKILLLSFSVTIFFSGEGCKFIMPTYKQLSNLYYYVCIPGIACYLGSDFLREGVL